MTTDSAALLDADPAAGLRAVAALIRERAQEVDEGPWYQIDGDVSQAPRDDDGGHIAWDLHIPNAVHIAAFGQPAVALAVADWLTSTADRHGHFHDDGMGVYCNLDGELWQCGDLAPAVKFCRAYLTGEVPR